MVTALNLLRKYVNFEITHFPKEIYSLKEVDEFIQKYSSVYLKLPWSSSGRGVVASDFLEKRLLEQWVNGGLRRQGSIMGEKAVDRVVDFATEWKCENGSAIFLGLSLFQTSYDGRYKGNLNISQSEINDVLTSSSPFFSPILIEAQKKMLEEIISPFYSGPLGIDMMIDRQGLIYPCVEINLRMTMGHVALMCN